MGIDYDLAFLRAVCAAPDDDAPRLVYADFLEESGEPSRVARAEFIRLQCALARLAESDPRRPGWRAREAALLATHRRAWNGPVHRRLHAGPLLREVRARGLLRGWSYRRGFIAEVAAHADAVVRFSDELSAVGPLERLRVVKAAGKLADLLAAPVVGRVRELDLSDRRQLTYRDAGVLTDGRLSGLRWLDLRGNRFGLSAWTTLREACRDGRLPVMTLLDPP